jgi:hypothetical protein
MRRVQSGRVHRAALANGAALLATFITANASAMGSPQPPTATSHPEQYCADRDGDGFLDPADCTFFDVEQNMPVELWEPNQQVVYRLKNQPNKVDNCPEDNNPDQTDADADGVGDLCEFTDLSTSGNHTCALRAQGTVSCWGDNQFGQSNAPPWTFSQVAVGHNHSCGLLKSPDAGDNGRVFCWGDNSNNQLIASPGTYVKIRANGDVTCAVDKDGVSSCWGACGGSLCTPPRVATFSEMIPAFDVRADASDTPFYGYCGLDTQLHLQCFNGRPPPQPPAVSFSSFDGGDLYGCGIQPGGRIFCFGRNEADPLGPPEPMLNPPVGQFLNVSVGLDHACAVGFNRQVRCWGSNEAGKATPPAGSFESVSVGDHHSCARATSGQIKCWGDSGVSDEPFPGALAENRLNPRVVQYSDMSANEYTACGVTFAGELACSDLALPRFVVPEGKFSAVTVGEGRSCARRRDGKTVCWNGETGESEEFSGVSQIVTRRYTDRNSGEQREYLCGLFTNSQRIFCRDQGQPTPQESDFTFGPKFTRIGVMGERMVCGITVDKKFMCQEYRSGVIQEVKKDTGIKFEQLSCNSGRCCGHDGYEGYCYNAMGAVDRIDPKRDRGFCRAATKSDPYPLNIIVGQVYCFDENGCTDKGPFFSHVCVTPPARSLKNHIGDFAMGYDAGCVLNEQTRKPRCFYEWPVDSTASSTEPESLVASGAPDTELAYISAGTGFACAVRNTDGTPVCWGQIRRSVAQKLDAVGRVIPRRVIGPIGTIDGVFEKAPIKAAP